MSSPINFISLSKPDIWDNDKIISSDEIISSRLGFEMLRFLIGFLKT